MYQQPSERAQDALGGRQGHLLNAVFVGVAASIVAGIGVWLLGYGGAQSISDAISSAEFSSSPPWLTLGNPHQDVAESAVMTLGDVPPGWAIAPDDGGEDDFDYQLSGDCKQLEEQAESVKTEGTAKSEAMKGPERQILRSDASVFAGAAAAQEAMDANRALFAQCGGELVNALDASLRQRVASDGLPAEAVQAQMKFEELPPPAAGEAGMAFRIGGTVTGPAGTAEFAVDFIAFRQGRMTGSLVFTTFGGVRSEEAAQLTQIAAAKLQSANATLEPA